MAHYDCSNCGSYGGVDFGSCSECTPPEYHALLIKRGEIITDARLRWETQHAAMIKHFQEWKDKGISELAQEMGISAVDELIHTIRMENDHTYRRKHEEKEKS